MKKNTTKKTEPGLPKGLAEQRLTIPWLVVKRDELPEDLLLVSAPDGVVLEFPLPKTAVDGLSLMLSDNRLWNTFFGSLLNSLKVAPGGVK